MLTPLASEYSCLLKMLKEMKCHYYQSHREKPRPQNITYMDFRYQLTSWSLGDFEVGVCGFVLSVMYWETDWSPWCINRISRPPAEKVFRSIALARLERDVSLRP